MPLFRVSAIGNRLLQIQGGSTQVIYFILQVVVDGEDLDRGIRGTPTDSVRELKPRPTLIPVSGSTITRQAAILRLGDYQLEIAGNQVTEAELKNATARIKVGVEMFSILNAEPKYIGGSVAYFLVFVRGCVV
jgi:hypothetical protein